jgi:hypothetical protein
VRERTYSLGEVIARGFEARCTTPNGILYFWHGNYGIRIHPRKGQATLLTDPIAAPTSHWTATRLGTSELAAASSRTQPGSDAAA